MKRFILGRWMVSVVCLSLIAGPVWGRGFGGARAGGGLRGGGLRGGGFGGGGFHGGGGFSETAGFRRGGGLSGEGFRPSSTRSPSFNRQGSDRSELESRRQNLVHFPGAGESGIRIGDRPQIQPGGGITRPDLTPGRSQRPNLPGATNRLSEGIRPGAGGAGTATLPGLGSLPGAGGSGTRLPFGDRPGAGKIGERFPSAVRPGTGGSGVQLPGLRPGQVGTGDRLPGFRPGQEGTGNRFTAGNPNSIPDRHQDLANRFDDLQTHWNDGDWHHEQWVGPNGGEVNHVGFWGPNGYWGHTGVHGPNGGYWGHSTGIGPNRAFGHTTGIGPNGAVWGHGGAIGPNGAFGYAGYAGPAGHWSRNWGAWYNGYAPAWGYGRWDYLWDSYPVAMAFGATMWGISAVNWAFGVSGYYNPYCDSAVYVDNQQVVSYTEPVVGDPAYEIQTPTTEDATDDPVSTDSASPDPLTQTFDEARQAFFGGTYDTALRITDQTLVKAPRDAAINEFRSLCLFALGQYRESAATIHAVLAAGPGWDWTTMISLYSDNEAYTKQLRNLEAYVRANPQSADAQFLLAYHYLTAGYKDEAVAMLKSVTQLEPKDDLAAQLVKMYSPVSEESKQAADAPVPDLEKPAYPMEKLYGDWTAMSNGGEFSLHLGDNDEFAWKFTRDGQPQSVSGAYIVRGNNLVMQPDTGGTMLSTITLEADQTLGFTPLQGGKKLVFRK